MPSSPIIPAYLSFKKIPSSWLSLEPIQGMEWHETTPSEISAANEIGHHLVHVAHDTVREPNLHGLLPTTTISNDDLKLTSSSDSWYNKSLKLSLETFKQLDEILENPSLTRHKFTCMYFMLEYIK